MQGGIDAGIGGHDEQPLGVDGGPLQWAFGSRQRVVVATDKAKAVARERGEFQFGMRFPDAGDGEIDLVVEQLPLNAAAVVVAQHQADVGIGGMKRGDDGRHQPGRQRWQHGDRHPPAPLRRKLADIADGGLEIGDDAFGRGQERLAVGGEPDMPGGAVKERHAQMRLELAHGDGQRRLRQKQRLGRAGKAVLARDRDEGAQMTQVDSRFRRHRLRSLQDVSHPIEFIPPGPPEGRPCGRMPFRCNTL